MKSKKFLFALEIVFFLIIPVIIIWLQYGGAEEAGAYKISITGVAALLLIFLTAKKITLDGYLEKITASLATNKQLALVTTDKDAIASLKKEYRSLSLIELGLRMVVPALLFIAVLITVKAVQSGAVKLFGALSIAGVSMLIGISLKVVEIYTSKAEHEE